MVRIKDVVRTKLRRGLTGEGPGVGMWCGAFDEVTSVSSSQFSFVCFPL